jgi:hypothetical protein
MTVTYRNDGSTIVPRFRADRTVGDAVLEATIDGRIADFFRALSGALDCFAGVIVFVAGLPAPILRSDMQAISAGRHNALSPEQRQLLAALEASLVSAGPPNWHRWSDAMRNGMLHRGRRMQFVSLEPRHEYGGVLGERATPVRMVFPVRNLPREPKASEHAALVAGPTTLALKESAGETMAGALASTRGFVASTAPMLRQFWLDRRARPSLIVQPAKQATGIEAPTHFDGFTGSGCFHPNMLIGNPKTADRIGRAGR